MAALPPFFLTKEETMRVYVALPLPDTFKAELRRRLLPLRKENPQYHWVDDAEDLHITISFPGELDEHGTQFVLNAVRESVAGFGPIRVSSPGLFLCAFWRDRIGQSLDPSRSLWLFGSSQKNPSRWGGVDCVALKFKDGVEEMAALADNIDTALMRRGKETDFSIQEKVRRPFIPYVVLVRRGRPRNTIVLYRKGKYYKDMTLNPPLECVLDKATVYISGKRSSGDVWTTQKEFPLTKP
jgi:2'-5' RNA ligase